MTAATRRTLTSRPLVVDDDLEMLHRWVTHERSRFWQMQGASLDDVRREYAAIVANPHHDARIGLLDGEPAYLMETYDPARHELAQHTRLWPGDLGMHFLVAPPDPGVAPVHGFTRAVIEAVLLECFADPEVRRVVVEPDAHNGRVHALNAAMGFVVEREITLSGKQALLSVCTRAAFEARTR
ncbi:GNAT family N-acetyltransferase [Nocardioides pacificus]